MGKVLGLTGPSGAGKSTVARLFAEQGCVVLDCDAIGKAVVDFQVDCLRDLCYAFGSDIVREDGTLDRALLAQRAFADKAQTEKLNRITHPWIVKEIRHMTAQFQKGDAAVIVLDAPTLFESGLAGDCCSTIGVLAPAQVRLQRIMERDGLTREQALLRLNAQPKDDFYLSRCDAVLNGCAAQAVLKEQVADLIRKAR